MTRETKIGLLVGLAFLLVVGILLSEHITGATERPAAPLADAGRGVRTGVSAPGAAADEPARIAEPQQPVPTPAELTPRPAVTHVTVVSPAPTANAGPTVVVADGQVAVRPAVAPPTQPAALPVPQPDAGAAVVVRAPTDPFANDPVARIARQMGETVIPIDPTPAVTPVAAVTTPAGGTTQAREYKAQPGDTLSRLAAQLPGGNTKGNRDAVVQLNPTLQKDPNRIISGRAYLLPTAVAARPAVVTPTAELTAPKPTDLKTADAKIAYAKASDAKTNNAKPTDPKTVESPSRVYVVRAGDTLSKIASIELGSKSEVDAIRKLNADVIQGDVIKVAMKLRLPAKVLASVR